jgi:hypothetical protein
LRVLRVTERANQPSFYKAAKEYYAKFPASRPKEATLAILKSLHIEPKDARDWERYRHEAEVIRYSERKKRLTLNAAELDRSAPIRSVRGAVVIDPHRIRYGPELLPVWLVAAVESAAAAGFKGWYRAGRGKLRSGMLGCRYEQDWGQPFTAQCYPKRRSLIFYPHIRNYDEQAVWSVVFSNLACVLEEFGPEDRKEVAKRASYYDELIKSVSFLLAAPDGLHVPIWVEGMEKAGPFEFYVPQLHLRVRGNDGSHRGCIELEFDSLRIANRGIRELRAGLADVIAAVQAQSGVVSEFARQIALHLTVMQQISEATQKLSQAVGNVLGAQASTYAREHLRNLDEEHPGWQDDFRMVSAGFQPVEVWKIVGSVSHGRDFRPDWVPFVEEERDRLLVESFKVRGFDADESNRSPISLVELSGEYFIEGDGHRRVSAAHRLKLPTVEAEVFRLRDRTEPADDGGEGRSRDGVKVA